MKKFALIIGFILLVGWIGPATAWTDNEPRYTKTSLLPDSVIKALGAELNGLIARDTIVELARYHRVQASSGFSGAAQFIAGRARSYGLQDVQIERFVADGRTTYHTLKSTPGWEVQRAQLFEVAPYPTKIADWDEMRVALADYSQSADVTAELVDVGSGTSEADYDGRDVEGKIVLAGGNVAVVHALACDRMGAAGILSYQPNQVTAWSGDYVDNVRWGHLSPYNEKNKFAFMISLRQARQFSERLARGERISLRANVDAEMRRAYYEIVTCVIPGTDLAEEEIVYSCHLCHQKPGANDNASGAAAILEVARALNALIRRGEIPPPRRTIRFVWPPEIAGTLAYFSERPEIVQRMKAAIHMDMVGGSFQATKSVLHVTHTPASLPSCVNAVADIFAEYAIAGSAKAASGGGFDDALIAPGGSKDALIADITPYQMGSDHDVYQEGSFGIPTIYLRDWPDVFIHTNNDTPANIDATKMKRSAFIAAASGYYLASAGAKEAEPLVREVFARAMARLPRDREQAEALEKTGVEGAAEARSIIAQALERDAAKLMSVMMLAPDDKSLEGTIEKMIDQLSGAWLFLTGQFTEQRRGRRITFTFEAKEPPRERSRARSPKDAVRDTGPDYSRVPERAVVGPMNVYYYDYVEDRTSPEEREIIRRIGSMPGGGILLYEILNLVDGERSIQEIRDFLRAAYGPIAVEDVAAYLELLERIGVVNFDK